MSVPSETDMLESLLPRYEAEGFEVFVHPSPSILPPFMQTYRPDAVALRQDKKIAIEVVRSASRSPERIQELQSLFAPHRDWELRVFYVSPRSSDEMIEIASRPAIVGAIERIADLLQDEHRLPALIMAWATLEAIGRALLPEQFKRPQGPARLVEVLASDGYLTPEEADLLRTAISLRNTAVHGGLASDVDDKLLDHFIAILRSLVEFLPEQG